jgi:hypothetical protein
MMSMTAYPNGHWILVVRPKEKDKGDEKCA